MKYSWDDCDLLDFAGCSSDAWAGTMQHCTLGAAVVAVMFSTLAWLGTKQCHRDARKDRIPIYIAHIHRSICITAGYFCNASFLLVFVA